MSCDRALDFVHASQRRKMCCERFGIGRWGEHIRVVVRRENSCCLSIPVVWVFTRLTTLISSSHSSDLHLITIAFC